MIFPHVFDEGDWVPWVDRVGTELLKQITVRLMDTEVDRKHSV